MRVRNADSKQSLHGGGLALACSGLEQNQQLAVWYCGGGSLLAAEGGGGNPCKTAARLPNQS
jgi:hypothetical protein